MNKLSQKSILYRVHKAIRENNLIAPRQKIIVAVSGGADSVALLDILLKLREKLNIEIIVCHYNHRLRGEESDGDEKFVQKICADHSIEFIVGSARRKNEYKNEEEARDARYAFFKKILQEGRGDRLAMAHNANDQAETFLLRLARGSGISGLKSIPFQREKFIRPLLQISRQEIIQYISENALSYRNDITNEIISYDRNFVRHQVLPLFEKLNPKFITSLLSTIRLIEKDVNLLESLANEKLNEISILSNKRIEINHKQWLLLPEALKSLTLRIAIGKLVSLKDITSKQIEEVASLLEKGVGKKHKVLPHSLRVELISGKIILSI